MLAVRPLTASGFGALVEHTSVSQLLAEQCSLVTAWRDHGGLVVIRGLTDLKVQELEAISALFGQVEQELDISKRKFCVQGCASVMRIGNIRDQEGDLISLNGNAAMLPPDGSPQYSIETKTPVWHTDSTFRERPPIGSALFCKIAPPEGGATCFADTAAAYDALTPEVREELAGLECICSLTHHDAKCHQRSSDYPLLSPDQRQSNPPRRVPVVLQHPITKRKALYGFNSSTCAVVPQGSCITAGQLDQYELDVFECPTVQQVLRDRLPYVTSPQFTVKWQWEAGDLVLWDNRCTVHCATGFDQKYPREMWRTTIVSDKLTPSKL